jgi:hypothetical protein
LDSDADRSTGCAGAVTLESGDANDSVDAGIYQLASLGDFVWVDANLNGIQDEDEEGISGVTVQLLAACDALTSIGSTTTDGDGAYLFADLEPGTYVVKFILPDDYLFSLKDQGGDDALDSDADPSTGCAGAVTLESGDENDSVDAGIYMPTTNLVFSSLGDFVWVDANANGIQDAGEEGISGVTVQLWAACNVGTPISSMQTGANGEYLFSNLQPGTYVVKFILPDSYAFSPKDQGGNDALDSDADRFTGCAGAVTLEVGQQNLTIDAGIYPLSSLGDQAWFDENQNGLQDRDENGNLIEPGLPGVTINLFRLEQAVGQAAVGESANLVAVQVATVQTDETGYYWFGELEPGGYFVEFVRPEGYSFTAPNMGGDDADDSDALMPQLRIAVDDGGVVVTPGGLVSYTIGYFNDPVSLPDVFLDAFDVFIDIVIPPYTTLLADANPGWVCEGGATVAGTKCKYGIGDLLYGTSGQAKLVLKVDSVIGDSSASVSLLALLVSDSPGRTPATYSNVTNLEGNSSDPRLDVGLIAGNPPLEGKSVTTIIAGPTAAPITDYPPFNIPGNKVFMPLVGR